MSIARHRHTIALVIILTSVALLLNSARRLPPMEREFAHVNAGVTLLRRANGNASLGAPLSELLSAIPIALNADKTLAASDITRARIVSIIEALALLLLVFVIAKNLAGETWALLPVVLLGSAPTFLAYGSRALPEITAALALLAAVWIFAYFIHRPTRRKFVTSGIVFGAALLVHPLGFMIAPINIALAFAALVTSIALDWSDTDPATRRHRFRVRAMRYARATFGAIGVGLLLAFAIYGIGNIGETQTQALSRVTGTATPLIVPWLIQNNALRPLGSYAFRVTQYINELQPFSWNLFTSGARTLSLPLIAIIALAAWIGLSGLAGAIAEDARGAALLLNHVATNPEGAALQLFVVTFATLEMRAAAGGEVMLLLPPVLILASCALKRWLAPANGQLMGNPALRILILAKSVASISLKTLILAALVLAAIIAGVVSAPNFSSYVNVVGMLARSSWII